MNIYVIRNNHRFGPYDEKTLLSYVNNGQVLKQDKAIADGDSLERTVGFYLKQANLKSHVPNKGNVLAQLSAIGSELIFPKAKLFSKQFLSDQRFLILALVGLLPMIIMTIPLGGFFIFYEVSLYFSIIWGLFFYACFKTHQVKLKTTLNVSSNPQPIGFSGILLAKRQNSFYCTYFLHNRNVADTKSPYPIKRLEVIRWFNQKSMVFNQSLS